MSIETDIPRPDYLGLPVLTKLEGVCLRFRMDGGLCQDDVPISYIGDMVLRSNPLIEEVVAHDIRQFLAYDEHDIPEKDCEMFTEGIREGYNFLIGCMTWIRMTRENESDIIAFVQGSLNRQHFPIISKETLARIKQVRTGNAPLEKGVNESVVKSSKDLSFIDAGDYCFMSEPFDDVLICYTDELTEHADKNDDPYVSGIFQGVANALEMYMQIYEEAVLANAR